MPQPFICWDSGKVNDYFTVEASSIVANLGWPAFKQLHVPIKKIEVVDSLVALNSTTQDHGSEKRSFIGEEELLRVIEEAPSGRNFIIAVRGGPGSGKSHLIRWLESQLLNETKFLSIPVSRDLSSVGAVLNRIANAVGIEETFLEDPGDDVAKLTDFLWGYIKKDLTEEAYLAAGSPEFTDLIRSAVEAYRDHRANRKLGTGRMVPPNIPADETRSVVRDFLSDESQIDAVVAQLQSRYEDGWMIHVAGQRVNIGKFLSDVDAKARADGRRPVLLLEDVTSFEVLHRDLMVVLSTEMAGGLIAVLGWTTAYERDSIPTNMLERIALRLSLTDDTSDEGEETYFLSENADVIDLVRTYMKAVRVPECGRGCVEGNCLAGAEDGLYPFTERGAAKIYHALRDRGSQYQRRTPRLLLSRVLHPLLDSAVVNKRFPQMDQVYFLEPIPSPALYAALGPTYADWVQATLWLAEDGGSEQYFNDIGVAIPPVIPTGGEPLEVPDRGPVPRKDAERANTERKYRDAVSKLEEWVAGGRLATVDWWLELVESAYSPPETVGISPRPGKHVVIEGSGASRAAPFATELDRSTESRELLQRLARRRLFGEFEGGWNAIRVLGEFELRRADSQRRWSQHLEEQFPVLGLFIEVLALDAAFDGKLATDDIQGILGQLGSSGSILNVSFQTKEIAEIRSVIQLTAAQVRAGLLEINRTKGSTYDIRHFQMSLERYRGLVARNEKLDISSEVLFASQMMKPDALVRADKAVRALYVNGLTLEVERVGRAISKYQEARPLGSEWLMSMRQVRGEFAKFRTPATAASYMTPFEEATQQFGHLVPTSVSENDVSIDELRSAINFAKATDSIPLRISTLAAVGPMKLQSASEISAASEKVLGRMLAEANRAQEKEVREGGASAADAAAKDLFNLIQELAP